MTVVVGNGELTVDRYSTGYLFTCSAFFETYPDNAESWYVTLYPAWTTGDDAGVFPDYEATYHHYPSQKKITAAFTIPIGAARVGDPVVVNIQWADDENFAWATSLAADITYHDT